MAFFRVEPRGRTLANRTHFDRGAYLGHDRGPPERPLGAGGRDRILGGQWRRPHHAPAWRRGGQASAGQHEPL